MLLYVLRRLLTAIPTMFVIVTLAFFLIRIAPGGPFNQERGLMPEIKANLEAQFGLNDPLWLQYFNYLKNLLRGNFGPSYNLPDFTVAELFANGLPISAQLGASALILALIVGGTLGIVAALNQNKLGDYAGHRHRDRRQYDPELRHRAGHPAPVRPDLEPAADRRLERRRFLEQDRPGLDPVAAADRDRRAIDAGLDDRIPARASYPHSAGSRPLATGLSSSSTRCAARVLPIVSYAGPAAAALLTGSIIVETIFAIPGVGRYFVDAALNRDYTLVMGTVVVIAIFTILFNLIVDILYAVVDPRVRYD